MSRIDQLISQYCPAGVPMVRLGEVEDRKILQMGRGNVISKEDILNTPGDYPVYSSSSQNNGMIGCYGKYMFDDERITWSIDGGGRMFYRNGHRYSVTNVCGWMKVLRSNELSTKYLYYALYNAWINIVFDYNHKAHPSVIRNEYFIPLPPLPVQEEIVRILDAMSDLVTNLDAEISARQKQYEHAREQLLTFGEEVERKTLGEVTTGAISRVDASLLNATNYVGVENLLQNKAGKTLSTSVPSSGLWPMFMPDDVLIGNIRPYLKKIWIADISGGTNGDVLVYRVIEKNILYPKFLNVVLASDDFFNYAMQYAKGAKMPRGSKEDNKAYPIPLPSLSVQQSIVERLDKMESLIQNLQAERALRQKQYEYYREKLLLFAK